MKIEDLEIFIETALNNVKRNKWDIEQGKSFIFQKINIYIEKQVNKIDEVLNKETV